jgi:hypothetical protein
MKAAFLAWVERYIIGPDPEPELSRLDLMDRPID